MAWRPLNESASWYLSQIIFVSMENSVEVVEEALSLGALGYVEKAHCGGEILDAVEAVSQGQKFVSFRINELG